MTFYVRLINLYNNIVIFVIFVTFVIDFCYTLRFLHKVYEICPTRQYSVGQQVRTIQYCISET